MKLYTLITHFLRAKSEARTERQAVRMTNSLFWLSEQFTQCAQCDILELTHEDHKR